MWIKRHLPDGFPSQLCIRVSSAEAANKQVFISVFEGGVAWQLPYLKPENQRWPGTKANQEKEIRSLPNTYQGVAADVVVT